MTEKWAKSVVSLECDGTLYLSVPFTWQLSNAEAIANLFPGRVVAGGPAVKLMGAPWADDTPDAPPWDVLPYHNPCATFTTRGCPNKCAFCAVPKLEGDFRELREWRPAPIVCDNNLTEASRAHFHKVINTLLPFTQTDFNQGLDARLFRKWHADEIARLKNPMVRFAFDHPSQEAVVHDAIQTARDVGLKRFGVYVLMGFNDTQESAHHRLKTVLSWGVRPNPMRYQPLDATRKNAHRPANWDYDEFRRMHRYYSMLRYLEHIPYDEYDPSKEKEMSKRNRTQAFLKREGV